MKEKEEFIPYAHEKILKKVGQKRVSARLQNRVKLTSPLPGKERNKESLAFLWEEGPTGYNIDYRPLSIEEITNGEYTY